MANKITVKLYGTDEEAASLTPTIAQLSALTGYTTIDLDCYVVKIKPNVESETTDFIDKKRYTTNDIWMGWDLTTDYSRSYLGTMRTVAVAFPEIAVVKKAYNYIYSTDSTIGFSTANQTIAVDVIEMNAVDIKDRYAVQLILMKRESE